MIISKKTTYINLEAATKKPEERKMVVMALLLLSNSKLSGYGHLTLLHPYIRLGRFIRQLTKTVNIIYTRFD